MTTQVVSFSGGRSSAYLVHLMELRRIAGEDVRYVFMDTGAEHPKTYEFIRNIVNNWKIDLICLHVVVNPMLGQANGYKLISVDDIGYDLQVWRDICAKYGTPYIHGPFCTRTMKIEPFNRYCKEHFATGLHKWIGIRADEPKRLKPYDGVSYLADLSDFDKQDVLDWWSEQPFDLGLSEHLGNCVFCIKKGVNKIALAARDEPQMATDFIDVLTSDSVRVVDRRQQENKIMYRDNQSLESIIAMYADQTREEIAATIRGAGGYDSGSCTESCEAFSCEIEADQGGIEEQPTTPVAPISLYCQKLDLLRAAPTHKLKEIGDQWRTPEPLFWGINAMFGPLVLDLFADASNTKCAAFYTAVENALA
ncbi:DNA N-6-adenine-methyltransferase, partial [Martelella alba]